MDVTLNPLARQISTLHTARFAEPEEKKSEVVIPSSSDQVTISQEGIETASSKVETLADKVATKLGTMTKADFMEQLKQWQSENQTPLEVDPYYSVDPDGSIATKTYFESYLGQLQETERTIKDYYSDAYNEAVSAPITAWHLFLENTCATGRIILIQVCQPRSASGHIINFGLC